MNRYKSEYLLKRYYGLSTRFSFRKKFYNINSWCNNIEKNLNIDKNTTIWSMDEKYRFPNSNVLKIPILFLKREK